MLEYFLINWGPVLGSKSMKHDNYQKQRVNAAWKRLLQGLKYLNPSQEITFRFWSFEVLLYHKRSKWSGNFVALHNEFSTVATVHCKIYLGRITRVSYNMYLISDSISDWRWKMHSVIYLSWITSVSYGIGYWWWKDHRKATPMKQHAFSQLQKITPKTLVCESSSHFMTLFPNAWDTTLTLIQRNETHKSTIAQNMLYEYDIIAKKQ